MSRVLIKKVSPLTVGMGCAKFVKKGYPMRFDSGPMTYCSSFVAKVYSANEHVGTIFGHQGNNHPKELKDFIAVEIMKEMGHLDKIKFKEIKVQTAKGTQFDNEDVDSTIDLAKAIVDFMEDEHEVNRVSEVAPGIDLLTTQMTAVVDKDGNYTVPRRKGMFEVCVIM